jgi:hypothetical protein
MRSNARVQVKVRRDARGAEEGPLKGREKAHKGKLQKFYVGVSKCRVDAFRLISLLLIWDTIVLKVHLITTTRDMPM